MPLLHIGIALSLILVVVKKCKGEGNRIDENGVFFLHALFDIIHLSGMKECCFRLQQLSVFQAVPCVCWHLLLFKIISAPLFLPPPSEEAKVRQDRPSPSLRLKSLSLLVHRDSFQILKRVIGRALAGANQPSTVASRWPSARLCELEGWLSSPSDFLYLISPCSCVWKRV